MIIANINTKGGAGKTTTAMFLAEAAHRAGRAVTVWDADPQGTAISWSDHAAESGQAVSFTVDGVHRRRIDRAHAERVEGDLIIDTPPGDPATISAAIAAADLVIVTTGPGGADIDRAIETMNLAQGAPALFLLTQYIKHETDSFETWVSMKRSEWPIFETTIPRRAAIQRAYGHKIPDDLYGHDRLLTEVLEVFDHLQAATNGA